GGSLVFGSNCKCRPDHGEARIARLHPEFAIRLAKAVREGRDYGLVAGIFSAYRPPAFGVGGFSDKFSSLHAYGLAVDLYGIGRPGSVEALWWHESAAKQGLICPYGHQDKAEWNHCQPIGLKPTTCCVRPLLPMGR